MEQGSSSNILLNNLNMNVGDMFRTQLNEETKLVILYALKNLPIEIKTIIIDEVDIYLDNELNDLEEYEEEYWYRDGDNEFHKLTTILNQQPYEEVMYKDKRKENNEHSDKKNEITSLKEQIFDLQNDLTRLRIHELGKLKKLIEQNQQVINMIKPIDIKKLETTVQELNKKIPDIEPLLKEFEKMFKTLDNIGKAIGFEE